MRTMQGTRLLDQTMAHQHGNDAIPEWLKGTRLPLGSVKHTEGESLEDVLDGRKVMMARGTRLPLARLQELLNMSPTLREALRNVMVTVGPVNADGTPQVTPFTLAKAFADIKDSNRPGSYGKKLAEADVVLPADVEFGLDEAEGIMNATAEADVELPADVEIGHDEAESIMNATAEAETLWPEAGEQWLTVAAYHGDSILSTEGRQVLEEGDFILRDAKGDVYPNTEKKFKNNYERSQNGKYYNRKPAEPVTCIPYDGSPECVEAIRDIIGDRLVTGKAPEELEKSEMTILENGDAVINGWNLLHGEKGQEVVIFQNPEDFYFCDLETFNDTYAFKDGDQEARDSLIQMNLGAVNAATVQTLGDEGGKEALAWAASATASELLSDRRFGGKTLAVATGLSPATVARAFGHECVAHTLPDEVPGGAVSVLEIVQDGLREAPEEPLREALLCSGDVRVPVDPDLAEDAAQTYATIMANTPGLSTEPECVEERLGQMEGKPLDPPTEEKAQEEAEEVPPNKVTKVTPYPSKKDGHVFTEVAHGPEGEEHAFEFADESTGKKLVLCEGMFVRSTKASEAERTMADYTNAQDGLWEALERVHDIIDERGKDGFDDLCARGIEALAEQVKQDGYLPTKEYQELLELGEKLNQEQGLESRDDLDTGSNLFGSHDER